MTDDRSAPSDGVADRCTREPSRTPSRTRRRRCRKAACGWSPLGGLGEIGRNMTVFEYDGRLLVVDCGVLFPEDDQPGVDLILPDFGLIQDRLDDIEAMVLTHGHEDHIGAVPYLLRPQARHAAGRRAVHPRAGRGEAAASTGSRRTR